MNARAALAFIDELDATARALSVRRRARGGRAGRDATARGRGRRGGGGRGRDDRALRRELDLSGFVCENTNSHEKNTDFT